MVLNGGVIWSQLLSMANGCGDRAWIASAYITADRLSALCDAVPSSVPDKRILVRWRKEDLVRGSSDLIAYRIAKKLGWKFSVNMNLHAKAYIFDDSYICGSANLTRNGMLGISPPANHELMVRGVCAEDVATWYQGLEVHSCEVDDALFGRIESEILHSKDVALETPVVEFTYSGALLNELKASRVAELYVRDLFWSDAHLFFDRALLSNSVNHDIEHDAKILNTIDRYDADAVAKGFLVSRAFRWLLDLVDKEMYFGELTANLHSALQDDPAPYRKDVKSLLNTLLGWTRLYGGDYFEIDIPRKSQRVRRIDTFDGA